MGETKTRGWVVVVVLVCAGLMAMSATALDVSAQGSGLVPQDGLAEVSNLSREQMVERGQEEIGRMKSIRGQTLSLLEETRDEEKDLLKLNCINERLSSIKGFLKVSEQSMVKLRESNDKRTVSHQFSLITLASEKVQNLGVEAKSCAGEALQYTGNTEVIPEIDGDIAEIDPTNIVNETETLFRLPEVTPYQ